MDLDNSKVYMPLSARIKIPLTTTPDAPYRFPVQPQGSNLEYVRFTIPQTGVLQDLGVRFFGNDSILYPAAGSKADSNFTSGRDSYGALPTSGLELILPFNRKLIGPPYSLTFEFYNDGAGSVSVNILVVTSEPKQRSAFIPEHKKEVAKDVS